MAAVIVWCILGAAPVSMRGAAFIARARCRTSCASARAAPDEPVGDRGFFEMYTNDELSSLLEVHQSLFPDAAADASGVEPEGDLGSLVGKGSLHDLVLGAIAEIDAANDGS